MNTKELTEKKHRAKPKPRVFTHCATPGCGVPLPDHKKKFCSDKCYRKFYSSRNIGRKARNDEGKRAAVEAWSRKTALPVIETDEQQTAIKIAIDQKHNMAMTTKIYTREEIDALWNAGKITPPHLIKRGDEKTLILEDRDKFSLTRRENIDKGVAA